MASYLFRLTLALISLIAFVVIGILLDRNLGVPFDITYRIACAGVCLYFVFKLGSDYPRERWPRIAFLVALLLNAVLFFTPLVDRPASRGELMLFALPDAGIVLAAQFISYRVCDKHQQAVRQQLIVGLIIAVAFCAILFALTLI